MGASVAEEAFWTLASPYSEYEGCRGRQVSRWAPRVGLKAAAAVALAAAEVRVRGG